LQIDADGVALDGSGGLQGILQQENSWCELSGGVPVRGLVCGVRCQEQQAAEGGKVQHGECFAGSWGGRGRDTESACFECRPVIRWRGDQSQREF